MGAVHLNRQTPHDGENRRTQLYYTQTPVYTAQLESQQQSSSFSTFSSLSPPPQHRRRGREKFNSNSTKRSPGIYGVHSWTPPFFFLSLGHFLFPFGMILGLSIALTLFFPTNLQLIHVSLCVCVVGNDFRVIPDTNWTGAGVLPLLKPYPLENKTKKHDCHSFFFVF